MEITIKGDAKEMAALVLAVQERREVTGKDRLFRTSGSCNCFREPDAESAILPLPEPLGWLHELAKLFSPAPRDEANRDTREE